jgi:FixJ family two-component response regulator
MSSILLLEDDADLREALALAFDSAGAGPVLSFGRLRDLQARSKDALASTCAVLDVNLGAREPTGLEAADWLRQHGFRGRIVFLTGHASGYSLLRETRDSPDIVIVEKPAPFSRLMSLVSPPPQSGDGATPAKPRDA